MLTFLSAESHRWLQGCPLQPHEAAAVLVQQAADGNPSLSIALCSILRLILTMPLFLIGERSSIRPFECSRERDCYYLHRKYLPEIRLAAWAILILQFFERPRWTYQREHWGDHSCYPQSGLPFMSDNIVLPLYAIFLAVIGWGVALEAGYEIFGMVDGVHDGSEAYRFLRLPLKKMRGRKTPRTLFAITLLVLLIAATQVIVALFCHIFGFSKRPFWVAPTMTLFILLAERSTSRRYSYMLRTLPTFVGLLFILGLAIALFTTMGFIIFSTASEEKNLYFDTFGDGLWNMYMILIGSNWPLPIIPSITYNRGYFLFFFVFVCFVGWGFLNLIIGYIFSTMTTQRDRSERLSVIDYKLNMIAAFSLLDPDAKQVVSVKSLELVLKEVGLRYIKWSRILVLSAIHSLLKHMFQCRNHDSFLAESTCTAQTDERASRASIIRLSTGRRLSNIALGKSLIMADTIADEEVQLLLRNLFEPVEIDSLTGKPILRKEAEEYVNIGEVDLNKFYEFPARCFGVNAIKLIRQKRLNDLLAVEATDEAGGEVKLKVKLKSFLWFGDTKFFDASVDILLAICAIMVLIYHYAVGVLYFMFVVMLLEFLIRYFSKGKRRFLESSRNIIDSVILSFILLLLLTIGLSGHALDASNQIVRGLILFRLCLILRNATLFSFVDSRRKKFKIALRYCARGAEDVVYLLLVMFFLAVAYCEFGVLVFGGVIQKHGSSGDAISASLYGQGGYWPLNFNDFASGLATLFTALHVNNMHVTSSGFEAVMEVYRSRLFFTAWHAAAVLLLLNVIPAFLLNNFWQYYIASRTAINRPAGQKNAVRTKVDLNCISRHESFGVDDLKPYKFDASTIKSILDLNHQSILGPRVNTEDLGDQIIISASPAHLADVNQIHATEEDAHSRSTPVGFIRPSVVSEWAANTWGKGIELRDTESCSKPGDSIADSGSSYSAAYNEAIPLGYPIKYDTSIVNPQVSPWEKLRNKFTATPALTEPLLSGNGSPLKKESPLFKIPVLGWMIGCITMSSQVLDRSFLAAILVQHAKDGIRPVLFSSKYASICYIRRMKLSTLFKFAARVMLLLCFFMRPSWTYAPSFNDWLDDEKYPKTSVFIHERLGSLICICLVLVLIYGVVLELIYSLEAEVVTGSTELAQCVAAVEDTAAHESIPLPLTLEKAESAVRSEDIRASQFKWFGVLSYGEEKIRSSNARRSDVSVLTQATGLVSTDFGRLQSVLPSVDQRSPNSQSKPTQQFTDEFAARTFNSSGEPTGAAATTYKIEYLFNAIMNYIGHHWFWRIVLILLLLEELVVSIYAAVTATNNNPIYVSLFSLLWFDHFAFRKFRMMVGIIVRFLYFIVFFGLFVLFLGIFASVTYQDQEYKDGNKEYFGNFQNSIWTIFLIITSTGFPTQILPSYSDSRDSIIFFIFTVSMGAFVFLNLILLVVNSEFETGKNKREAVESNYRSLNLQLAFEILDIENKGFLLYSDIDHLLEVLYTNFSDFRKRGVPSDKMRRILVACMDVNSNRKISTREFSMILDVTRISLKRNDRHNYMELCFPGIIKSVIFQKMRRIVLHRHFSLLIDTLILVCMCIEFASGKSVYSIVKRTSQISLGAMCIVMLIEMLLKLAVFGKRYFAHFDRKLEYFFSVSLVLILIFTFGINVVGLTEGTVTMRLIGLGRLCLALRNVDLYFPALGFKNLAKIFLRVGKNLGSLTISFLVTMISFCILGMYLFGGLINRDPNRDEYENILESRYGDSDYWPLNFNDIPSGLMTLVCVLHISDWDVITEGFTAAVGNKYPRIYFTSWYCIGVLLLLNIVKSFFMRGFFINREIFISTTRADVTQSSSLPDDDTVLISVDTETQRPRRETQAYIHGYNAEDVDPTEIKDNDLFSASIGALKFLPTEEKFFLMNRIDYVLKEGQKYREF